jgi:hypothetical protein
VLRTIGDARAYMLALPKEREAAYRLLVRGANAAELALGRFTSPCPWMASLTLNSKTERLSAVVTGNSRYVIPRF